jgi:hypothetical protein
MVEEGRREGGAQEFQLEAKKPRKNPKNAASTRYVYTAFIYNVENREKYVTILYLSS